MRYDKRVNLRRGVHIPAKLIASRDAPLRDCVVLDISELGARLGLDDAQDTPEEFTVLLAPQGRPYRRCRVVWRTDNQMGVIFDKDISSHTYLDKIPFAQG